MTMLRATSRRGAALLVVLATLILMVSASTILISAASTIQAQRSIDQATLLADDLLVAAEAPIQHWLSTASAKIVLPPEATTPQVKVLHDQWVINDVHYELRITAWDQRGMAPLELVLAGSPLRLTLPAETLQIIDKAAVPQENNPAGLDSYLYIDASDASSPFPSPNFTNSTMIFGPAQTGASDLPRDLAANPDHPISAFGALVATHNSKPFAINVNTAPIALVEAALASAGSGGGGRGGLEQIIAARSNGTLANIGGQVNADLTSQQLAPNLITTSNIWSFRIDARVGALRKSWWAVYGASRRGDALPSKNRSKPSGNLNPYQWSCVQRLVITH